MNYSNYSYWLFDWDGCLANTYKIHFDTYVELAKMNGINFTKSTFLDSIGDWQSSANSCGFDNLDLFKSRYKEIATKLSEALELNKDAGELLQKLKRLGKTTAIVTTSQKEQVQKQMNLTKISKNIDLLVGEEDTEKHKPHPDPLFFALEKLGAKKEETIFIGDTENDIIAGERAGVSTVWYNPKSNREILGNLDFEDFSADIVIEDFATITLEI